MQYKFEKRKIFIWGTGRNCQSFLSKYELYQLSSAKDFKEKWNDKFIGFIDKSTEKIGTDFYGKMVYSPGEAIKEMDYCIITVADNSSIIKFLKANGFIDGQWILWTNYLDGCKSEVLQLEQSNCNQKVTNPLASFIEMHKLLEINSRDDLLCYRKSEIAAAIEWYYDRDIDAAQTFVGKHINFIREKEKIKTIGIVIDRLYGGGIEKVVSLLLDGFKRKGYDVVVLTDPSGEANSEYTSIDIVHFTNKGGNFEKSRLEDLESAIKKYNIDILCFHTGYARVDTYYEIILAKMLGVFVTMEIHTAFIALLKDQIDVSLQFMHMYRQVDRLITVSETDVAFFKCMDCKSILIENPIETFGVTEKTERIKKRDYLEVLWVGRIVQQPKRVLDAVYIIKLVHDRVKNIRLRIVGIRDNEEVYRQLKDRIKGIEDYVTIDEYKNDIREIYSNADLVLMTSASESFSNVLAEAKVMARPVVMYELPWLRLAYDNTGVCSVKQRDILSAAEAIISLLQDEELWKKYSDNAWKAIQTDMKRDVVDEWIAVFENLENNININSEISIGMQNTVCLLLNQMYGTGYPDY